MPSPCCKRKYNKPSKCTSPCNNCECFVQSAQCPPTSEDDEGPVLYTPVIAAPPLSKKCCCSKCCCAKCEIKQKKSLWQQLFGERKCCSPCQKKKQDCLCKQKKKQRCVSECTNQVCCSGYKQTPPPPAPKPCKPACCCKVKTFKCKPISKPCCPTAPESLFGCHFYCNVENRDNRPKQPRCQCCSCCTCVGDNKKRTSEELSMNETTDEEKETNGFLYTNNKCKLNQVPPLPQKPSCASKKRTSFASDMRTVDSVEQPRFEKLTRQCVEKPSRQCVEKPSRQCVEKPIRQCVEKPIRQSVEPARSNIHIGLTFTNTDTKYYKKSVICPPIEEDPCYSNNENEEVSSGSSEQIITLEIHQSNEKVDQDKKESQRNQNREEENVSMNSSKRRMLSTVREENENNSIKSESYGREIKPLIEKKRNSKDTFSENKNSVNSSPGRKENRIGSKRRDLERSDDNELDKRVSEILRRLRTIESKINMIDTNKTEDKNFKIDIDDNKSTISFHFKDGKLYDSYDSNDYRTPHDKNSRKADAVIEIRQTRSKSCSPVRKHSTTQMNRKYRYSRSLDRGIRAQREKPKLIIKVPHGNKVSQGAITVYNNKRIQSNSRDCRDTEWKEISNELKSRNPAHTRCYCYECICQRARCK